MPHFTLVRRTAAPPEAVFEAFTNHRAYPGYTPFRKAELEKEGEPAPNGVGAIRVLHAVGPALREEVVEYDAPTRFVYRLLSGAPLRDHVGTVLIEPTEVDGRPGSRVVYAVDTTPTVPIGRGAVVAISKLAVKGLLDGCVKEAERRAGVAA